VKLHVIYTRSGHILLSRRLYDSWQQIQQDVDDYMASLGPWAPEETIEYLDGEHPGLCPSVAEQVRAFLGSPGATVCLLFERDHN
jgi:hypothetical protein